jgi:GBP family porin
MVCDTTHTFSGTELVCIWLVHGDSKHLHVLDGDLRMKKSLFALAALGAFASAAQAQSTVTLYGTFDSSVAYLTDTRQATSATIAAPTTVITTGSGTAFIDSSFATSAWGMRGSEDLGGGMKANFHMESDLLTNNGNTHSDGLFRRAANVSIAHAKYGEVFLGRRGNAYIMATGQMLPVQGNTAHQWRAVNYSSIGDQISNQVAYATPTIMGTNILVGYGINNTIDAGDDGEVFAAHLRNTSIKGLTFLAAYNNQKARQLGTHQNGASSGANTVGTAAVTPVAATPSVGVADSANANTEGYAVGMKYKVTPAIEAGILYSHGRTNNSSANGTTGLTAANAAIGRTGVSVGLTAVGIGYQATPAILLGANYASATSGAKMTNLQGQYMLSKRTRLYSQITMTQAATMVAQGGGGAARSFSAIGCNSNTTLVCHAGLSTTAGAQNVPADSKAYSVGVIHTF